jgi:peptidyl-prolyl cis-trans isomerase SurA
MSLARGVLVTLFLSLALLIAGCSSSPVVLEYGPHKVTLKEYEAFYTKNSGGWEAAQQSSAQERERFLDLLTNYKLKLQDAEDRGLIHDADVQKELREYRTSLASTFLIDREITDPGMRKLYERRKEYLRAEHILIGVKADASPADTLAAYTKALEIMQRIMVGERFDSLARKYSEDPSVKTNNGDIYYFTAGQMVGPFEKAAFATPKGELVKTPIRSQFGYHIIRVLDREPTRSIKVRHIMARFASASPDSADMEKTRNRLLGYGDSLKKGWSFADLATKVSEDPGSAQQGGDLGWFERRRWVQPFDEAAFKLSAGELSGVVRTPYGFHLIHCDSTKPFGTFEQMKEELRKQYQQSRYTEDYAAFLKDLKTSYGYTFHEDAFAAFLAKLDTTRSVEDSAWDADVTPEVRSLAILTIAGRPVSVDTVIEALATRPDFRNTLLRNKELRARVDRLGEILLLERRSAGLETSYPEFATLMKEYDDGVVLYKAEQLEVWSKSSVSDSAIKQYYEEHKGKFMFPERVHLAQIEFDSDTVAAMVYDSLSHGADFTVTADAYNGGNDLKGKGGERGVFPVDTDEETKHANQLGVGEISLPFEGSSGGYVIVKLLGREAAREKTFEEAAPEVSNVYQEELSKQLEKEWLDKVKAKYPVKQYPEQLVHAFTQPPKAK